MRARKDRRDRPDMKATPLLLGRGTGARDFDRHRTPPRPVIGIEAEFTLFVNGVKRKPEKVFGTPAKLIGKRMIPRTGRSFQLPSAAWVSLRCS